MEERRKHVRIALNKHAWIYNFDESAPHEKPEDCQIVDISEGGACIQCSSYYKEGQPLAFTYQDLMEEGSRPVIGVVMWSKRYSETDCRCGVKFLGLSTQMLSRIQEQVSRACEGPDSPGGASGFFGPKH